MNQELIRIVDGIARDRNISRDQIYTDIEQSIASALRKQFNTEDTSEFTVTLDRGTGVISAARQGVVVPLSVMGRIAAQTAKQVMIQLIRQDERGSIYEEFKDRVGAIVTGTIARFEGNTMIVSLGRAEGIMRHKEQIPGEAHQPGERIQALVMEVMDTPSAVKIFVSRAHSEFVRRLFEREVPEVGERTIELRSLAREPGHRTKIAVTSIDSKVDAVGACVGVRGSRIKNIVDELGGEKIDIVRWNESSQVLISNSLKPAEVTEVSLCFELGRATVVVNEDQLSLAIGKRGQNVRLAAKLTGWDIDILTPVEFQKGVKRLEDTLKSVEGVSVDSINKLIALGLIDVRDFVTLTQEGIGITPLVEEAGVEAVAAQRVLDRCAEEAKLVIVEEEHAKAQREINMASAMNARQAEARESQRALQALLAVGEPDGVEASASAGHAVDGENSKAKADNEGDASNADDAETDGEPSDEVTHMPDPMESTDGAAPEITVHQQVHSDSGELSPEEEAIQGLETEAGDANANMDDDDDSDTAALAEGRLAPPAASPDEPR